MKMKRITYLMCCVVLGFTAFLATSKANAATDQDKQFLAKASQANVDEIKLGELAEHKATDPAVKAFAHKMVVDHTALGRKMKPFATEWGLTVPTTMDSDHQDEWNKLNGLSGHDFDKEYIDAMVKDHDQAYDLFNDEVNSTQDAKFKVAVEHGKSVIAAHKNMAHNLQGKL
jgi:putative membrane protein